MTKVLNLIKRVAADENGTALIEYTLLLSAIIVAVLLMITQLGGWISNVWQTVCTDVHGSAC